MKPSGNTTRASPSAAYRARKKRLRGRGRNRGSTSSTSPSGVAQRKITLTATCDWPVRGGCGDGRQRARTGKGKALCDLPFCGASAETLRCGNRGVKIHGTTLLIRSARPAQWVGGFAGMYGVVRRGKARSLRGLSWIAGDIGKENKRRSAASRSSPAPPPQAAAVASRSAARVRLGEQNEGDGNGSEGAQNEWVRLEKAWRRRLSAPRAPAVSASAWVVSSLPMMASSASSPQFIPRPRHLPLFRLSPPVTLFPVPHIRSPPLYVAFSLSLLPFKT
ncbi:hypothetical protein EJ06DRAFT_331225 [Trichodelitschia bisporula]|uniref:Uncharacterized protein n=1 Tax=Trichodelitschia bisporula TaxID=703511 RepID=A0A6G1I2G2_9PEZI|nr:hypothetical protein EJ06DRAFT_331225 [Trichodelitschia bisporula]